MFKILILSLLFVFCQNVFATVTKLKNGWTFHSEVDKITDENKSFIMKEGKEGGIAFICHGKGAFEPAWAFGTLVPSSATFMYRFDKDDPVLILSGLIDTIGEILYLNNVGGFTEKSLFAKLLVLQASGTQSPRIVHEFNLTGLKEALEHANKNAPCK